MKKTLFAPAAVFFLAVAFAAADSKPRVAPPPLRVEAPTLQPSPAHVWVPGYWKWAGINYEWVEGRWAKAKAGRVWAPGVWENKGSYWAWTPGKWEKVKSDAGKGAEKGKKRK
ncbi:MAG TPA: YXWGXW repeat-containing protein [Candidatus Aminicenantes bacterium]|nr:YXWGXW repeat-containing protein [Candidatus Aminicenantes bacterium]